MASLKPFVLNLSDLEFILAQVKFRPLFNGTGDLIFSWDGTQAIYGAPSAAGAAGVLLFDPAAYPAGAARDAAVAAAIASYGQGYAQPNAAQGLRDVSGMNNNLFAQNADWGAVDQAFLRTVAANWSNYVTDPAGQGNTDYSVSFAQRLSGGVPALDEAGRPIFDAVLRAVVDGTPRMISLTTTTAGVTFATDVDGHIAYDANGVATVTDWGLLGQLGQQDKQNPDNPEFFIGAQNPGVSPVNGWFALFGQFFDHGLDFIAKDSGVKITIPLDPTDPLYNTPGPDGRPVTSMVITRATVNTASDGTSDPTYTNHTSPFIDQSQTYGSNAQITSLMREWVLDPGTGTYRPGAQLLDGRTLAQTWERTDPLTGQAEQVRQTLPTLNELRAHLVATGRSDLTWEDVNNLRVRDASGHVLDKDAVTAGVQSASTGHALLLDMNPRFDTAHLSAATQQALSLMGINAINGKYALGGPNSLSAVIDFATFQPKAGFQALGGEVLLEAVGDHYVAGDGRVNENFGLTTIHHVFHEEHNYQVANVMAAVLDQDAKAAADAQLRGTPYDHSILKAWLVEGAAADPAAAAIQPLLWDQDRLFNATKLIVEMEYQHVAVDQYARTVTPDIAEFVGYSSGVDPTVTLEYAQVAFRFGHSTLRETIDTIDPNNGITGKIVSYALKEAFLSPGTFADVGPGAIVQGMTQQQMNEIDEFVTPALNQGLLGQPLDLAAINIARGRDLGIPTLNDFRTGLGLATYKGWADFGDHMIHPENLVNFIAAYSFDGDVAQAHDVLDAFNGVAGATMTFAQAWSFMNGGDDGYARIDAWLGGLAEAHVLGGLLGETFNKVFVDQISQLMNGDRFYYLYRLFGQQFAEEVNNEQFKDIVERNTGVAHLNGSIFAYADQYYDMGKSVSVGGDMQADHTYGDVIATEHVGIFSTGGASTAHNGEIVTFGGKTYILDMRPDLGAVDALHLTGENLDGTPDSGSKSAEVIVASDYDDIIYADEGDDTLYLEKGNDVGYGGGGIDRMYGGDGADTLFGGDGPELTDGGAGDDLIYGDSSGTAMAGMDQLIGGSGNDTIHGGIGIDKISAGAGDDLIFGEQDTDPFTRGGDGNDSMSGGESGDLLYGDGGDDIIAGDEDQDILEGGDGDDILRPGAVSQAMGGGPDEVLGGDGVTDTGFDLVEFTDYQLAPLGVVADFSTQTNPLTAIDGTTPFPAWTQIEGMVGSRNADTAIGDGVGNWLVGGSGNDRLEGGGGNDIIIGSSIKLSDLIGTYAGPYTNEVDGASHRAVGLIQSNGLIDLAGAGFEKHFTELLRTERFKDYVLGDGGKAADADVAVFSGNWREYSFVQIGVLADGSPVLKITDNGSAARAASDGTDIVAGVETLHFQDRDFDISQAAVVHIVPQTQQGQPNGQLQAVVSNLQPWSPAPTYQWQRFVGGQWVDVANATGTNYTPPAATPAAEYRVVVHAGNTLVSPETAFVGTANVDTITGSSLPNIVIGLAGNDVLDGTGGNDSLWGGTGNDQMTGGAGNDSLDGGSQLNNGADVAVLGGAMTNFTFSRTANTVTTIDKTGANGTDTIVNIEQVDANSVTYTVVLGNTGTGARELLIGDGNANTMSGGAGDDAIFAGGGNDTITWAVGDGNDLIDGGAGTDQLTVTGTNANETLSASSGLPSLTSIEVLAFNGLGGNDTLVGGAGDDLFLWSVGDGADSIAAGGGTDTLAITGSGADETFVVNASIVTRNGATLATFSGLDNIAVSAAGGNDVVTTGEGNDTITGGTGNDTVTGGAGDDSFVWSANGLFGPTDGRDVVNGGTEGAAGDTFVVNGNINVETFAIWTRAEAAKTAAQGGLAYNGTAEIVVTRSAIAVPRTIIAELTEIEEIVVNGSNRTNGGAVQPGANIGGDTIQVFGDFATTSLRLSTITVEGGEGDDTVDISRLTSAHRIVFKSNGGNDVIVGQLRPQDVIELAAGTTPDQYTSHQNGDGTTTLSDGSHSVTYRSSGAPAVVAGPPSDGSTLPPVGDGSTPPVDNGSAGSGDVPPSVDDDEHDDPPDAGSGSGNGTGSGTGSGTDAVTPAPAPALPAAALVATASADALAGTAGDDNVQALGGDDAVVTHGGADAVLGGEGADLVNSGADDDIVAGGAGDDLLLGGTGGDDLFGDAGADRIYGGAGADLISGGAGNDTVFGGAGDDIVTAEPNDGNDVYWGDAGIDTYDASAATGGMKIDIGTGLNGKGSVAFGDLGSDTIWGFENVVAGSGNDTITASNAVNVLDGGDGADVFHFRSIVAADGDTILGFQPGDKIDLSAIDANTGTVAADAFTIVAGNSFTAAGQLLVSFESTAEGDFTVVKGNVDANTDVDFTLRIAGHHELNNGNVAL